MATGTNEYTNEIVLSDSFFPLLEDKHRYLVLCGGKGSGKSEFAARKLFFRCQTEGGHRFLILRKFRTRVRESVLEVMKRLLAENHVAVDYNKTERIMAWGGNELLFDGLDDPEKIKSIKGLTGVWIEETTEFTEDEFLQIDLCFREPGPHYKQIILSFNPMEALAPWLKKRFFDQIDPQAFVHNSTVNDNPIAEMREEYLKQLEAINDETTRDIYLKGLWALPKGQIYNWDVVDLPKIRFDEIFYGGDFGYTIDPAVCIRIYRKADEFWVEELIYQTGLINRHLGELMKDSGVKDNDPVYFDSSEPKSIDELCGLDLNVLPAEKGPDSVRAGIDFLRSKKIHIVNGSTNIASERSVYSWKKDKFGNTLPEPSKFKDHCFVAGTLVSTQRGQVPIERVTVADYALTRGGYRRVIASGMTKPDANVMTAYLSDGRTITGTGSHPIWANGQFIPLDTIRYGDTIELCQDNALSIKGFRTEGIWHPSLFRTDHTTGLVGTRNMARGICTGKYGKLCTAKYRQGITFIIGTAIRQITQSTTLNCARLLSIARNKSSIARATLSTWLRLGRLPWPGIALEMAGNGIANTASRPTRQECRLTQLAPNAVLRSRTLVEEVQIDSVLISASQRGEGPISSITNSEHVPGAESLFPSIGTRQRASARVYVLGVAAEKIRRPVYNLTVSDIPEFYANGVLVHNCMDAIRYGIHTHCKRDMGGFFVSEKSVY